VERCWRKAAVRGAILGSAAEGKTIGAKRGSRGALELWPTIEQGTNWPLNLVPVYNFLSGQIQASLPTVLLFDADPIAEGVVPSLARPGGNLAGVMISTGGELIGKRLQLLKKLAPAAARVACIASSQVWESYSSSAADAEIPPVFAPVNRSEQFDEAFATILRERADALVTEGSPIIYVQRGRIVTFAVEHRLPLAANNRELVEEGALMSYGISAAGLFSELAVYVDRILKGESPSDLPIQRPTRFELVINARTAKALGLTPPPTLVAIADEVIE
jgi:putative tryptophan/tyrosine transport system substrate-binding protein